MAARQHLTIAATEPVRGHLEASRTATILISDVASNRTSLGEDLWRVIEGAKSDLLKIYAAALIIKQVDLNRPPTLDFSYALPMFGAQ